MSSSHKDLRHIKWQSLCSLYKAHTSLFKFMHASVSLKHNSCPFPMFHPELKTNPSLLVLLSGLGFRKGADPGMPELQLLQ